MVCERCDYSGYSPSGAVVLDRGEVECETCDGTGELCGACGRASWDCPCVEPRDCAVRCEACEGKGHVKCECEAGA